jgi:glycosyltransferase involved in cell wall biosynthesis
MRAAAQPLKIGITGPIRVDGLQDLVGPGLPVDSSARTPFLLDVVRELHSRGHFIDVFCLYPESEQQRVVSGDRIRVHIGNYRARARERSLDWFAAERSELVAAMTRAELDLIHAHWTYEHALAALASNRPTVVTVHDWAPTVFRHQPSVYRLLRVGLQRQVLSKSPSLTANSPHIADHILKSTGRTVPVTPNGIRFGAPSTTTPPTLSPVIGALNNGFTALKNVTTLLVAFKSLRAMRPSARLLLAGADFEAGGKAAQWANARGYGSGVEFVGPLGQSEVEPFLRRLDVFAHPSHEESFGMVLLEAIRAGVPVVAGVRSGAVPWVLDEGAAGHLVDVRSPAALAMALDAASTDPSRGEFAQRAYANAQARFDLTAVVDAYEVAYRAAIATSAP